MKTRTEIILVVLKYLALLGAIGFSIDCGAYLLTFLSSFINLEWAQNTYRANKEWFSIRENHSVYFIGIMALLIITTALKGIVWYLLFNLLHKIQLKSPFSMEVTKRLETISYLLLFVWLIMAIPGQIFAHYLLVDTGVAMPENYVGDEYFFIAGIVFIITQIFKRGIEMQEENQLTV